MDDYKQPDTPETADEPIQAVSVEEKPAVVSLKKDLPPEPEASVQAEPKEEVQLEFHPQAEPKEEVQLELHPQAEPKEEVQLELHPQAETEVQSQEEVQPQLEPEVQSEPEVQPEAQPQEELSETSESAEALEASEPAESAESSEPSESQSVFNQAVTLDAIQDSELVKTVNKAKQLLSDLDEAQKDKTRLAGELKQSEKAYSSMEKSVAEGITTALKKKKEEIAATYDRELSQYQDQIDVCKTERAKAKANAIAQRIQVETAPLNQQNQQLEAQIELKFKENKVPVVCKKRAISMLFFPQNGKDWTIDVLVGVALMFLVPLFFSLAISNRFVLAFTFFLYAGVLFAAYLYLLHNFMLKFAGVNAEVEELRKQIRVNNKNKQLMTNRIKKSQDETGYNLGGFDDKISGIQQIMQETVAKRQEALENFESEIRHQITADITAANKDELLELQQAYEGKRQELADKKEAIEEIEKQLKEEYEPVFGKDLLYKQRLNKFDSFCQENADLSLEDALTQYRALSGSKLLKK